MFPRSWLIILCHSCLVLTAAQRLVSTSPQATEWIYQLGKGGDLVAVGSFSDYPEAAKSLPRLGPLFAPGIETIVRYAPNWVISDGWTEPPGLARALSAARIDHFLSQISSVDDLFKESERLLRSVYGAGTEAIEPFRRCVPRAPQGEPALFLAFVWSSPPILYGHRTFLSDLISLTGGKNALPAHWDSPYPQVSEEWLLKAKFSTLFFLDEFPDSETSLRRVANKLWPGRKIRFVGLPGALFARASFTPLQHVERIRAGAGSKDCPS